MFLPTNVPIVIGRSDIFHWTSLQHVLHWMNFPVFHPGFTLKHLWLLILLEEVADWSHLYMTDHQSLPLSHSC